MGEAVLTKTLVARWESKGKRYWVEVYEDRLGFTFRTENSGGSFPSHVDRNDAVALGEKEARHAPSKMTRVI